MITILKDGLKKMRNDIKNGNINKQIANLLTLSRFFSPFILLPLYYLNKTILFITVIILFCLTDTFDGYFARKYNSTSLFGRYLDAVVDKIFALTLLIPVLSKPLFIILIIEIIIALVNLYKFYKNLNPKTKYIGKIKTTFLFVLIGLLYLNKFIVIPYIYTSTLTIMTIVIQVITLLSYLELIKKR